MCIRGEIYPNDGKVHGEAIMIEVPAWVVTIFLCSMSMGLVYLIMTTVEKIAIRIYRKNQKIKDMENNICDLERRVASLENKK